METQKRKRVLKIMRDSQKDTATAEPWVKSGRRGSCNKQLQMTGQPTEQAGIKDLLGCRR